MVYNNANDWVDAWCTHLPLLKSVRADWILWPDETLNNPDRVYKFIDQEGNWKANLVKGLFPQDLASKISRLQLSSSTEDSSASLKMEISQ